jgi:hypothetical protein
MNKALASRVLALSEDPDNLTKTAQIRAVYPEILQAKKAGVSNEALTKALNAQGIEIDLKGLVNILYRLKKETPSIAPAKESITNAFADFAKPNSFKRTER